jgi:hypothetical protein
MRSSFSSWIGALFLAAAMLCSPIHVSATSFTYTGFTSTAGLTLIPSAATVSTGDGTVLRLTPAIGSQSGAAYSTSAVTPPRLVPNFSFVSRVLVESIRPTE